MKKILPLIFVAVLMIFAVAQTSEAAALHELTPTATIRSFMSCHEFDGFDSLIITVCCDGNAYATALDADGLPDPLLLSDVSVNFRNPLLF